MPTFQSRNRELSLLKRQHLALYVVYIFRHGLILKTTIVILLMMIVETSSRLYRTSMHFLLVVQPWLVRDVCVSDNKVPVDCAKRRVCPQRRGWQAATGALR